MTFIAVRRNWPNEHHTDQNVNHHQSAGVSPAGNSVIGFSRLSNHLRQRNN
jgi:hypothetical protein